MYDNLSFRISPIYLPYPMGKKISDKDDHICELVKFIYSENATKVCEISTVDLSYIVPVNGGDFAKFCGVLRINELYWQRHFILG